MTSINYHKPNSLDIYYVGGNRNYLRLMPGLNLNINEKEWAAVSRHPIVKKLIELGTISVIETMPNTADLDGVEATLKDDPESGQPFPVNEFPDHTGKPQKRWNPTKDELIALRRIGEARAEDILSSMPEGGFASFDQFKALNEGLKFDNSEVKSKFQDGEN